LTRQINFRSGDVKVAYKVTFDALHEYALSAMIPQPNNDNLIGRAGSDAGRLSGFYIQSKSLTGLARNHTVGGSCIKVGSGLDLPAGSGQSDGEAKPELVLDNLHPN
jgi:hypothetical protein